MTRFGRKSCAGANRSAPTGGWAKRSPKKASALAVLPAASTLKPRTVPKAVETSTTDDDVVVLDDDDDDDNDSGRLLLCFLFFVMLLLLLLLLPLLPLLPLLLLPLMVAVVVLGKTMLMLTNATVITMAAAMGPQKRRRPEPDE